MTFVQFRNINVSRCLKVEALHISCSVVLSNQIHSVQSEFFFIESRYHSYGMKGIKERGNCIFQKKQIFGTQTRPYVQKI